DNPDDLVHEMFVRSFWRNHPLGAPILGTVETVKSLTLTDLYRYYRERYAPGNLIVSVAGHVSAKNVANSIEKLFRRRAAPSRRPPPGRRAGAPPRPPGPPASAAEGGRGARTGPRVPGRGSTAASVGTPLRRAPAGHHPRGWHVVPALPAGPRETRPRVFHRF